MDRSSFLFIKEWGKFFSLISKIEKFSLFSNIFLNNLHSVSFGSLRFPKRMFKDIFKLYPHEPLFTGPLSLNNKMISYDIEIEEEMTSYCKNLSLGYINEKQIFKCSI